MQLLIMRRYVNEFKQYLREWSLHGQLLRESLERVDVMVTSI